MSILGRAQKTVLAFYTSNKDDNTDNENHKNGNAGVDNAVLRSISLGCS